MSTKAEIEGVISRKYSQTVETRNGEKLVTDLQIDCGGVKVNVTYWEHMARTINEAVGEDDVITVKGTLMYPNCWLNGEGDPIGMPQVKPLQTIAYGQILRPARRQPTNGQVASTVPTHSTQDEIPFDF